MKTRQKHKKNRYFFSIEDAQNRKLALLSIQKAMQKAIFRKPKRLFLAPFNRFLNRTHTFLIRKQLKLSSFTVRVLLFFSM